MFRAKTTIGTLGFCRFFLAFSLWGASSLSSAAPAASKGKGGLWEKAQAAYTELGEDFGTNISLAQLNRLPAGFNVRLGTSALSIAIDKVESQGDHALVRLFIRMPLPGTHGNKEGYLFFAAENVKFSKQHGLKDGFTAILLDSSASIPIVGNNRIRILGNYENKLSFCTFECGNKFKEFSLAVEISLANKLYAVNEQTGKRLPGKSARLKATTSIKGSSLNDLLIELSLPAFATEQLPGFIFKAKNVVLDLSDRSNSPNCIFPEGYLSEGYMGGQVEAWQGFSLSNLLIACPKEFSTTDQKRVSFEASNMLVDRMGLSGNFKGTGLLSLQKGRIGSWAFSIDSLGVSLLKGQLVSGGLSGKLRLPVDETTQLAYNASILKSGYLFNVALDSSLSLNFFGHSRATLAPNSMIEFTKKEGQDGLAVRALLHGDMEVAYKKKALLTGKFTELQLQTVAPKFSIGSFRLRSEGKLNDFPISISEVSFAKVNKTKIRLGVAMRVSLIGKESGGISGETKLSFTSSLKQLSNNNEQWKLESVGLDKLSVNSDLGGFKLKGKINLFEDDPNFGTGFSGKVVLSVIGKIDIQAMLLFGSVENSRFWFADFLSQGLSIPLCAGINIDAFGGAIYQHMSRTKDKKFQRSLAKSLSGAYYRPDRKTWLGLKAAIGIASQGSSSVFNALASFEIAFNQHLGIRYITIDGDVNMLTPPLSSSKFLEKVKSPQATPGKKYGVYGNLHVKFDFEKSIFHANINAQMDLGVITGAGKNNSVGSIVIHMGPDKKYIYVGRPDNRIGVRALVAQLDAYLMVGTDIPGSPPPPQKVADILGMNMSKLDYMRDLNALGNGKGFAFGAALRVKTSGNLAIFYWDFDAGIGFDIMLKEYAHVFCKNNGGKKIGMDGWYANGQAYAYLSGAVGVEVNLWFTSGRFPIIEAGLAALIQAKLPNPSWFSGRLGGYYSVLGGLVSGRFSFNVELGEKCDIASNNPLAGVEVIGDMSPRDKSSDVDVFSSPQLILNLSAGKVFSMEDKDGVVQKYRVVISEFALYKGKEKLEGYVENWNESRDELTLTSKNLLPNQSKLTLTAIVSFEQKSPEGWQPFEVDGKRYEQEKSISFTSGERPKSLAWDEIEYLYPLPKQSYVYRHEKNRGFIKTKHNYDYLFEAAEGQRIDFTLNGEKVWYAYNSDELKLTFGLEGLKNSTSYALKVVNKQASPSQGGVSRSQEVVGSGENETRITSNKSSGTASNASAEDVVVLTYGFATSKFNTFKEKTESQVAYRTLTRRPYDHLFSVQEIQFSSDRGEAFAKEELQGHPYSLQTPIQYEALLSGNAYWEKDIAPLIYNPSGYTPPTKEGLILAPWYLSRLTGATKDDQVLGNYLPLIYGLPYEYNNDLGRYQTHLLNRSVNSGLSPKQYTKVIQGVIPLLRDGDYKIRMQYILPDGSQGSVGTVVGKVNLL